MAKTMHRFDLVSCDALGQRIRFPHELEKFDHFLSSEVDRKGYFRVDIVDNKTVRLVSPKGSYLIPKHSSQNSYQGIAGSVKVHITLKKLVGELRAWY